MKHQWKNTIWKYLHKTWNVENPLAFRSHFFNTVSAEEENSAKDEQEYGHKSNAYNDYLHNFSFINTSKTEYSPWYEENKDPKVEILKDFCFLNMIERLGHDFASHDALGYRGAQ